MSGRWQLCAAFVASVAVVSQLPAPVKPAPRPPRPAPDLSLVVLEFLPKDEAGRYRARVQRISVRGNTALTPRTVWEGDESFVLSIWPHRLVANRYLVTDGCGVLDLYTGEVINDEEQGKFRYVDARQLRYCRVDTTRGSGDYSFHFATGTLTRVGDAPKMSGSTDFLPSPDGANMISAESGDSDIIYLYRDGESAKRLDGFVMEMKFDLTRSISYPTPMLWLDDDRFLAQRGNGKLVTVDLDGKVTNLLTIKDAGEGVTRLSRDAAGAIIYSCAAGRFKIDAVKKTAAKSVWEDLGHGFETRRTNTRHELRHDGRDIGPPSELRFFDAKSVPGYLALHVWEGSAIGSIAVWSAATGEWTKTAKMRLDPNAVVGWIK